MALGYVIMLSNICIFIDIYKKMYVCLIFQNKSSTHINLKQNKNKQKYYLLCALFLQRSPAPCLQMKAWHGGFILVAWNEDSSNIS